MIRRNRTTRWRSCWPTSWAICAWVTSTPRRGPGAVSVLPSRIGQALLVDAALSSAGAAGGAVAAPAARAGATSDGLHFLTRVGAEPGHTRAQKDEADCIGYRSVPGLRPSPPTRPPRGCSTASAPTDQQKRAALADSLNDQLKSELGQVITPRGRRFPFMGSGLNAGSLRSGLLAGAGRMASGHGRHVRVRKAGRSTGRPRSASAASPNIRPTPIRKARRCATNSTPGSPRCAARADGHTPTPRSRWRRSPKRQRLRARRRLRRQPPPPSTAPSAAKTRFAKSPLVLNEAARLRDDMGDAAGADRRFTRAHLSPDQTVDGYQDHVRMLYRTQQNDRALQIIQQGIVTFNNDDKPFLAMQIAVSRRAGRADDVERFFGVCVATGDEALWQRLPPGRRQAGKAETSGSPARSACRLRPATLGLRESLELDSRANHPVRTFRLNGVLL